MMDAQTKRLVSRLYFALKEAKEHGSERISSELLSEASDALEQKQVQTKAREQAREALDTRLHGASVTTFELADAASDVWEPIVKRAHGALMDASALVARANRAHPDYQGILDALDACREALG